MADTQIKVELVAESKVDLSNLDTALKQLETQFKNLSTIASKLQIGENFTTSIKNSLSQVQNLITTQIKSIQKELNSAVKTSMVKLTEADFAAMTARQKKAVEEAGYAVGQRVPKTVVDDKKIQSSVSAIQNLNSAYKNLVQTLSQVKEYFELVKTAQFGTGTPSTTAKSDLGRYRAKAEEDATKEDLERVKKRKTIHDSLIKENDRYYNELDKQKAKRLEQEKRDNKKLEDAQIKRLRAGMPSTRKLSDEEASRLRSTYNEVIGKWGESFGNVVWKETSKVQNARAMKGLADEWLRLNKKIADPGVVTGIKQFREQMNLTMHGLEGGKLSIRNFSASLGIIKRDVMDLVMWQARWYGAKAILFTPLQGAAQGIKDFTAWEQAMKNVNAVSDATAEDMKKLEDTTLKVGRTTATSAIESAKAMLEFAQAGVDVDTIQKALPVSAKMVIATQEDISTAVSALTTIYNVWREDAQDMETVGGKLAASMAESKLKVADLSTVFNYLATSSKLAGISLSDTLTLVTALSQAGVKASTIGTGLGNFISRMTTIKGEWKKTLESKGLNISELTLPENSMIEVLKKLKAAGVDVIDLFKGLEIRAGRTAGALLSMVDRLDDISSKINQPGILEKMFGKSMEGIDNQLKNMKNKLQVFFLELGRDSIGGIQNLVSVLQSLVDILISLKTEIQMVAYALAIRLGVGAIGFLIGNVKELIKWFKAFKWELLGIVSEKWWITIGITFVIWFNAKMQETMDKEKIKIKEYVSNLSKEEAQTLKEALEKRGKTVIPFEGVTDKELKKKYQTSLRGFYKAGGERYGLKDIEEELNKAVIPELSSHTPVPEKIKQRDTSVKEKIKKSFREQLSLEEKARKDELTLTKSFNDLKMSILDNARKLNLLSEEKYYEQSIETAKENFDNDIRIAEATYAQFEKGGKIYEEYLNDKELEKDSTKQLQLDQRFLTEKREAEIKVLTLQNDKTKELLRLYTEEEARIQKVADEYAKLYEVSYDIAEQTKAQTEKGISERQIVTNEYLYGKMKISSEKYYNEEYDRIELDLRHAKDAAVRKADIAIAETRRRLRGQDPGILIKEEEKINEEKNKEINAAEETALKERLNLHYKYLEDLRALYQSKGTAAVTGKILEDLSIQSLDMANNLKSAVESISSSMESAFMDFLDHTSEGFLKWENLVTNVLNEITKELIKVYIVKQLIGGIQGVIGGWFSSGETDVAGLQNLMPGGYRASGGPVSLNRAYLVGEQGPELFIPNSNGNIVPNGQLGNNVNVLVNVTNNTKTPVNAKQSEAKFDGKKYVVGVILEELSGYGPLRHAIKGVR